MTVGIRITGNIGELGAGSLVHAVFSTISSRLEPNGWGSRFPELVNELYQGRLPAEKVEKALNDVRTIREELKEYSPDQVVWDIEKPDALPPWGDDISPHIDSLANYFVTSTGRDLLLFVEQMLEQAVVDKCDVTIESY